MKLLVVAMLGGLLLVHAGPANADVEIRPDPEGSSIILNAKKRDRPSDQAMPGRATPARAKGPYLKTKCFFDASEPDFRCALREFADADPDEDEAELTEGDIVRAVREIGLPSLEVQIQPGEETLVNVETIFYTRPQPFERSVTLLGFEIDLVASPVRYTWVHDDGTVATTSRPGKPYPAMDVTHRYREPAEDVRPRVDVTYRVRYRVDGGAWQTIGQTLQASGPAAELDVREAAPVLTKP